MPRKDENVLEKEQEVYHSLIDLDSGDNNQDQNVTPPLIQLNSYEEGDINKSEKKQHKTKSRSKTSTNFSEHGAGHKDEDGKQTKDVTTTKNLAKLTGTADRKASLPMKSPPPRKTVRHTFSSQYQTHSDHTTSNVTRRESIH